MAVFYMPFLIAFCISFLIEPIIKKVNSKTELTRKTNAIIVLIIAFAIIVTILALGITVLINEGSNLLSSLNTYIDEGYKMISGYIDKISFKDLEVSSEIESILKNSLSNLLNNISNWLSNILSLILSKVTSIGKVVIYIIITILATYFICVDRMYILDVFEHHFPREWVKKISRNVKKIAGLLGGYLKAEITLVGINFILVLIGLYFFKIFGLNVGYPLLIALGIAFADALPILGSGTVIIPWAIISSIRGDITLAISLIVLYIIISIVRQVLEPKMVSNQIGIHPIFTLIAMYTGYKIMGFSGVIMGPIILIIVKPIFETLIDKGIVKTIFDKK